MPIVILICVIFAIVTTYKDWKEQEHYNNKDTMEILKEAMAKKEKIIIYNGYCSGCLAELVELPKKYNGLFKLLITSIGGVTNNYMNINNGYIIELRVSQFTLYDEITEGEPT